MLRSYSHDLHDRQPDSVAQRLEPVRAKRVESRAADHEKESLEMGSGLLGLKLVLHTPSDSAIS